MKAIENRTWISVLAAVLTVVVLAGCTQATPAAAPTPTVAAPATQPDAESEGGTVEDLAGLVSALEGQGANVEEGETVEQSFFPVSGRIVRVNGQDVQVFEFEDVDAAQAAAATVDRTGSSIGTSMVGWVDTPHFYHQGRLIVLYIGSDAAVLEALEAALGAQFAGG
ncbi:MAG TPA: hypothetical protein VER55_04605 [Ardenticatenaceae bacterium]|nr:hypothetical protein [Ardenticatenaceae bacterium]